MVPLPFLDRIFAKRRVAEVKGPERREVGNLSQVGWANFFASELDVLDPAEQGNLMVIHQLPPPPIALSSDRHADLRAARSGQERKRYLPRLLKGDVVGLQSGQGLQIRLPAPQLSPNPGAGNGQDCDGGE